VTIAERLPAPSWSPARSEVTELVTGTVGTPVWLREAVTGAGGTEMLFHFTNEVLGDDNRSSSSSSSSSF
jgi:hypothetical protein